MVFALLVAAILWNLATWWRGLPASSSHTMIGSIIGVGVANQLMQGNSGTAGVDWEQVTKVFKALALSPVIGFVVAALVFFLFKAVAKDPRLYKAPEGTDPPPFYIRAMLILTCTGVSFFHGSNDGQKGMGLIMLILVGTVPTAYALNHTVTANEVQTFAAVSTQVAGALSNYIEPAAVVQDPAPSSSTSSPPRSTSPASCSPSSRWSSTSATRPPTTATSATSPPGCRPTSATRCTSPARPSASCPRPGAPKLNPSDAKAIANYKSYLDHSTKFIPSWVKVAVALALGLGTMVGWKRIVVTVGEKIGKTHLTYAQGAAAEITAMFTIGLADGYGLPVSTTHVLSSGVAGTMAANQSGLQMSTLRDIALAWIFTLPAAAVLSGRPVLALQQHRQITPSRFPSTDGPPRRAVSRFEAAATSLHPRSSKSSEQEKRHLDRSAGQHHRPAQRRDPCICLCSSSTDLIRPQDRPPPPRLAQDSPIPAHPSRLVCLSLTIHHEPESKDRSRYLRL